jgi:hypothetical protein
VTVARWLAMLPLALVLWRPVSGGELLYPALAALAFLSLVAARRPTVWLLRVSGLLLGSVVLMLLIGSMNDNPGLMHQASVWIGAPIIWLLWANSFTEDHIRSLLRVILVVCTVSATVMVVYVGSQEGLLPQVIPPGMLEAQGAGFGETAIGTSQIRFFGLSTLAGAGPLAAAGVLAGRSTMLPSKGLMIVAAIATSTAAVVAGRQAILVVTVLAPVVFIVARRALARQPKTRSTIRIHPAVVVSLPVVFLAATWAASRGAFEVVTSSLKNAAYVYAGLGAPLDLESRVRTEQASQLLWGWSEDPFFGAGLGAALPTGFVRSTDRPWQFELQYHQLLYNGGLVGVLLVAFLLWVAFLGMREAARRRPDQVPTLAVTLTAALGMLAANASNPYLQAVGHWWAVTLVLGVTNALLRGAPEPEESSIAALTSGSRR